MMKRLPCVGQGFSMQAMPDKHWTILVVDDEVVNRKVLSAFLHHEGFQVLTAQNGTQARELAHSKSLDLILLDIMMPGESGFETCAQLKNDPQTSGIPIIFLSALDDVQSKVQGFHAGGVDYVTKPFHREEILARVKTHLKLRQAFEQVIAEQARRLREVKTGQQQLLVQPEDDPEAKYGVYYAPKYEAGGDFYDVFQLNDSCYAYFIGDISGHDLSVSLVTSAVKALVRQFFSPLYSAQESVGYINDILRRSFFHNGRHMTAACLILDRRKLTANIVSAGHPQAIYMAAGQDPRLVDMDSGGDVLGVFQQVAPGLAHLQPKPGDRFLLYSDGLIEHAAHSGCREQGIQDLLKSCTHHLFTPDIQQAVQEVVQATLSTQTSIQDDIVAMGVEV
jgi:sigma-B regulation protein RsbU (phosphoserine phosphatase)